MSPIFTIGHSARTLEVFIRLLKENGVTMVADIRTIPRSRYNPQFNQESLPSALKEADIGYIHIARLGGLRHPRPDSPNGGWRNASFRGFADYMQTADFEEGLRELAGLAEKETVVLMCAEAVPWRCHRSLIADALLVRGIKVEHIMGEGNRRLHELTPWAKVTNDHIIYPPEA